MNESGVLAVQRPLRARYKTEPGAALVRDRAVAKGGSAIDPFHSTVSPRPQLGVEIPVGVHCAIGGPHDAPTPGDILCAALAACQDSSIRMVANLIGIELETLEVEVTGDVDVRGTMAIDPTVPVGFQSFVSRVRLKPKQGTQPEALRRLQLTAERCCVVLQTLRSSPPVRTVFEVLPTAENVPQDGVHSRNAEALTCLETKP